MTSGAVREALLVGVGVGVASCGVGETAVEAALSGRASLTSAGLPPTPEEPAGLSSPPAEEGCSCGRGEARPGAGGGAGLSCH